MNQNILKTYAPQARGEFIRAVTAQAGIYGITAKGIKPVTEKGDVVIIEECRPISKMKSWRLVKVVSQADSVAR